VLKLRALAALVLLCLVGPAPLAAGAFQLANGDRQGQPLARLDQPGFAKLPAQAPSQAGSIVLQAEEAGGPGSPVLLAAPLAVLVAAGGAFVLLKRRRIPLQQAVETPPLRLEPQPRWQKWEEVDRHRWQREPTHRSRNPALAPEVEPHGPRVPPLGRVVVVIEAGENGSGLPSVVIYEIGSKPMTVGVHRQCDIVLEDPDGGIMRQEARLWVQNGRLMCHRLSSFTGMAMEESTGGWEILENGDYVSVGPYRLIFQAEAQTDERAPPDSEGWQAPRTPGLAKMLPRFEGGANDAAS
jgi:hypothetical protein